LAVSLISLAVSRVAMLASCIACAISSIAPLWWTVRTISLIVDDASRIVLATFLIVSAALSGVRFVVEVRSCLEYDDIILLLFDSLV
jgi:hypothetical protein